MTRYITIAGYLVFTIAGIILWLVTRSRKHKIAAVSELFERILHHRTTRVAILCAWWWVGWHFLVSIVNQADF
ncbi:MAG: hypothetical protein RLZ88_981 [Actinomycetota bacterium]|jgi:uncharacterized membrane protein (DUF106 family)